MKKDSRILCLSFLFVFVLGVGPFRAVQAQSNNSPRSAENYTPERNNRVASGNVNAASVQVPGNKSGDGESKPPVETNSCSDAKSLPTITGSLVNGQGTVAGCAEKSTLSVRIAVIDAGAPVQCSDTNAKFAQTPTVTQTVQASDGSFSSFTATLGSALKTGQQVCLTELDQNQMPTKVMPGSALVAAAAASSTRDCDSTTVAYIPVPPIERRTVISGCAGQAQGARVVVYRAASKLTYCPAAVPASGDAPSYAESDLANVNPKTGIFQVELMNPLIDGDLICPYALPTGQNSPSPPVVVERWGYDAPQTPMGRTHYYISTGAELSQDNQQFSNIDPYLSFSLDHNWIRHAGTGQFNTLLNSQFDAELESIPVAATSMTTIMPTTSMTSSRSTSMARLRGMNDSSSAESMNVSTFISSRKAASISGDIYVPMYFNAFKGWFGGQTTAFFAPLAVGGMQTITAGALSATATTPNATTTTSTVNGNGLYYYWGAGLRFGNLRLHRSWNNAPELLSHLDLTVGQWENFKQCRENATCLMNTSTGLVTGLYTPYLFSVDGQLDIPKTPIQIGVKSVTPLSGGGKGDLRFYFGVKLDVGCLYKAFKGGSTPSFLQCAEDPDDTAGSASGSDTTKNTGGQQTAGKQ